LRPAQQFDVELATREQHIVQRFADIVGFDACAAIASDACLGDAPHQLLDERGADALGPLRRLGHDGIAKRQAPAIELDQLVAADLVRERHLDRLIDASGRLAKAPSSSSGRLVVRMNRISASCFSPSIWLRSSLSNGSSQGPIRLRSRAIRSTSSITTIAGCRRRARFM
jgi:hypothetical protein